MNFDPLCPPRIYQAHDKAEWVRCSEGRGKMMRYGAIALAILMIIVVIFFTDSTSGSVFTGVTGLGAAGLIYYYGHGSTERATREWDRLEADVARLTEGGKLSRAEALLELEKLATTRDQTRAMRRGLYYY